MGSKAHKNLASNELTWVDVSSSRNEESRFLKKL